MGRFLSIVAVVLVIGLMFCAGTSFAGGGCGSNNNNNQQAQALPAAPVTFAPSAPAPQVATHFNPNAILASVDPRTTCTTCTTQPQTALLAAPAVVASNSNSCGCKGGGLLSKLKLSRSQDETKVTQVTRTSFTQRN